MCLTVQKINCWDGRTVEVYRSRGPNAVCYLRRWEDNLLPPPDGQEWPPSLLRQVRGYVASRSWFAEDDAQALSANLGKTISKFQSVNSEDSVTWSWFGTLALADSETRRDVVQWLYDMLELDLRASADVGIDQWARVVHPNALESTRGPELDARIDDPGGALIYVEAKWNAELGTGKGAEEGARDDQVVLRRDSLRVDPALVEDDRVFVVLGVSNTIPELAVYEEPADVLKRPVRIAWITWDDLAGCSKHPLSEEFRHFISWKRSFASGDTV